MSSKAAEGDSYTPSDFSLVVVTVAAEFYNACKEGVTSDPLDTGIFLDPIWFTFKDDLPRRAMQTNPISHHFPS